MTREQQVKEEPRTKKGRQEGRREIKARAWREEEPPFGGGTGETGFEREK